MTKYYKELNELYWIAVEAEKRQPKVAQKIYSLVE